MSTVIKVENLSKKYIIRHEGKEEYATLRDIFANTAKALASRIISPFSSRIQQNTRQEEFWALKDVSFEVNQGERIGIIGRNGAGKSTLLKLISRITEPTEGRISIKGRVSSLLEVGTGFHPELTGRENIYLNGAILGMSKKEIDSKFDEIVSFAEVEKFLDTPVKRYSSGMQVRLAFAVAAHLEPEILLVDEVLAVGDAQFQKKCLGKMKEVAGEGRTILFVSHNMVAIKTLCSKTLVLNKGMIHYEGDTETALEKYLDVSDSYSANTETGYYKTTDRKNTYMPDIFIKGVTLLDKNNNPSNNFYMGRNMNICIELGSLQNHLNAEVGVLINNSFGLRIASINTGMTNTYIEYHSNSSQYAILEIPELPITPGDYYIDLAVAQKGFGRLDFVENAAKFTVLEEDVYGTGYKITNYFGFIYLKGNWRFVN